MGLFVVSILYIINVSSSLFVTLKESNSSSPFAWVTMLTSTSSLDYQLSSLVLRKSMQTTKWPFVLLVTFDDVSEEVLNAFDVVIKVPVIPNMKVPLMWEKVHMFALTQFKVITWLGSDMVALKNVDELMHCSPLPCGTYDENLWQMDHVGVVINGDLIVCSPSLRDYNNIMEMVREAGPVLEPFTKHPYTYSDDTVWLGPLDQGVLNTYFRRQWTILPKSYQLELIEGPKNVIRNKKEKNVMRDDVKLIHFASDWKPWRHKTEMSMNYWCPIAVTIHPNISYCEITEEGYYAGDSKESSFPFVVIPLLLLVIYSVLKSI